MISSPRFLHTSQDELPSEVEALNATAKSLQLNATPSWVRRGTVPCLNGLRAFAILCVIASHVYESKSSWSIGHFGVTSFFVISGFLITLLLLRERHATSTVSLSAFYTRRVLRILPAYFALLFVTALLAGVGLIRISGLTWISVLTYTSCFVALSISTALAHTWSLSVEEHFYFLWPIMLSKSKLKWSGVLVALYVLAAPVIRYELASRQSPALDINYSSIVQMSSIGTGCLLALLVTRAAQVRAASLLLSCPIVLMALGCAFMLGSGLAFRTHPLLHNAFTDPIRALAFGCIMLGAMYSAPENLILRVFENKFVNYLGVLSYSLYLWQQMFTKHILRVPGGAVASLVCLALLALLSYHFVEKPFLTLKNRLSTGNRLARLEVAV